MNAENANNQMILARETSHCRRLQLVATEDAIRRLECQRSSRESRTLAAEAVFLAFLAGRLEDLIAAEIAAALDQIEKLSVLPDAPQWEYRSAVVFGVGEAINCLGVLQARIIGLAQTALYNTSLLLAAQEPGRCLPVRPRGGEDVIADILLAVNPKLGKRMLDTTAMAASLSADYLHRARLAEQDSDESLSSVAVTSKNLTLAKMLASLVAYATEATRSGVFLHDPARSVTTGATTAIGVSVGLEVDCEKEYLVARLLAAGAVSGLVSEYLQKDRPFLVINLN